MPAPPTEPHPVSVGDTWWAERRIETDITPSLARQAMSAAEYGDVGHFAVIARSIERRDAQLLHVLLTRKLAVVNRPWEIIPGSEEQADLDIAEQMTEQLNMLSWRRLLFDLLDGLYQGFAAHWLTWDVSEGQAGIVSTQWTPQEAWTYQHEDWSEGTPLPARPRYRTRTANIYGEDVHPYQVVLHQPVLTSGLPQMAGLKWATTLLHILASYGLKDWATFVARFGLPWIMVRHPDGLEKSRVEGVLKSMQVSQGSTVLGIPQTWLVDALDLKNAPAGRDAIFQSYLDWIGKRYAQLYLGQTASSEGTPGRLGNEDLQEHVREDIRSFDGALLDETIQRDIIIPWMAYNAPDRPLPTYRTVVDQPGNLQEMSTVVHSLVQDGLPIGQEWAYERFGIPPVDPEESVLSPSMGPDMAEDDDTEEEDAE